MKIFVAQLRETMNLEIKGDEPWLVAFYESFRKRLDGTLRQSSHRVSGTLRIDPIPGDVVHVTGSLSFDADVTCGRCGDDITCPVAPTIDAYYENERESDLQRKEINLGKADLERFFIKAGAIDIEELINESVQMELPLHSVKANDDGSKCLVCDADLSQPMVYREDTHEDRNSPFAVLGSKNLKH